MTEELDYIKAGRNFPYTSRQELAEWVDDEGGLYSFITGHGFDSSEIDPDDTEFVLKWKAAERAALALRDAQDALQALPEWT